MRLFKPCDQVHCRFYKENNLDFPMMKVDVGFWRKQKVMTVEALHCMYSGCTVCKEFKGFNLYVKGD